MTVQSTTEEVTTARPDVALRRGVRLRDYGIVIALLAIVVALSLSTDTFFSKANRASTLAFVTL